jgi:hypothetical protein
MVLLAVVLVPHHCHVRRSSDKAAVFNTSIEVKSALLCMYGRAFPKIKGLGLNTGGCGRWAPVYGNSEWRSTTYAHSQQRSKQKTSNYTELASPPSPPTIWIEHSLRILFVYQHILKKWMKLNDNEQVIDLGNFSLKSHSETVSWKQDMGILFFCSDRCHIRLIFRSTTLLKVKLLLTNR